MKLIKMKTDYGQLRSVWCLEKTEGDFRIPVKVYRVLLILAMGAPGLLVIPNWGGVSWERLDVGNYGEAVGAAVAFYLLGIVSINAIGIPVAALVMHFTGHESLVSKDGSLTIEDAVNFIYSPKFTRKVVLYVERYDVAQVWPEFEDVLLEVSHMPEFLQKQEIPGMVRFLDSVRETLSEFGPLTAEQSRQLRKVLSDKADYYRVQREAAESALKEGNAVIDEYRAQVAVEEKAARELEFSSRIDVLGKLS